MLAKPHLHALWKKPLRSGTYFGVTGYLLLTPTIEWRFKSNDGVECAFTGKSTTYLAGPDAKTDIGIFLQMRQNLHTAFSLSPGSAAPQLSTNRQWTVRARNTAGGAVGMWSNSLKLPLGLWRDVPIARDWQNDESRAGRTVSNAPPAKFSSCRPPQTGSPPTRPSASETVVEKTRPTHAPTKQEANISTESTKRPAIPRPKSSARGADNGKEDEEEWQLGPEFGSGRHKQPPNSAKPLTAPNDPIGNKWPLVSVDEDDGLPKSWRPSLGDER